MNNFFEFKNGSIIDINNIQLIDAKYNDKAIIRFKTIDYIRKSSQANGVENEMYIHHEMKISKVDLMMLSDHLKIMVQDVQQKKN